LRTVGGLFKALKPKAERALWRWYYALPGDAMRKRRRIVWLHTHAAWLTRGTESYRIHAGVSALAAVRTVAAHRMDEDRAHALLTKLGASIRFSLVLLAGDADQEQVARTVGSLVRQYYPNWELLILADSSTAGEHRGALEDLAAPDPRIHVRYHKRSDDRADSYNAALRFSKGDFVAFLDNAGTLTRDALLEIAGAINRSNADLVYCDDDTVKTDGRHSEPSFKPDFSLDYLFSANFIGGFSAVRRRLLQALGGFRRGLGSARDHDLLLRISEKTQRIEHVAHVLYHRHDVASGRAPSADGSETAALNALRDALARRGIEADVEAGRLPDTYRVRRHVAGTPLVSILLPFRDKPELLKTCVTSVLEKTRYANFELVGIDNGSAAEETHALMRELSDRDSRVRFIRHDVPFNYSAIVNFAVTHARGEHLLMLNNDTEVISEEWMEALLEHSQRPEVGAVGALLQFPNDSIQHGGVIVGVGGVAGHAHLMLPARHPGYCGRAQVIQNLSAVTFACAMTRRDVFDRVGGLDAVHLIAAYNDIDYCLRLREAGYLIVYTPYAELYHHESASRPHDLHPAQRARYEGEIRYMKERHARFLERGDPYYSPHLSLTQPFLPLLDYAERLPA
jgi:GT2 family glycosyltransferase